MAGTYKVSDNDLARAVAFEQHAVLYRQLDMVAWISLATTTSVAAAVINAGFSWIVIAWYVLCLPVPILTLFLRARKRAARKASGNDTVKSGIAPSGNLMRATETSVTFIGCVWGSASLLFGYMGQEVLLFLVVMQAAVSCGFAQILAPLPRIVVRFSLVSLVPTSLALLLSSGMITSILGMLAWVLLGSIMFGSWGSYLQLRRIIHSEARAKDAQALLHASIDVMPDAFAVYSPTGKIIVENTKHKEWELDYELPVSRSGELTTKTDEGTWMQHRWRCVPDAGTLSIHSNITTQKQREALLIEARRMAELASGAQSRFLSRMSHELRTPLNSVLGFSELLRAVPPEGYSNESIEEYSTYIHDSGQHLLALVDDVIDYARLGDDGAELHIHDADLDSIVKRAISLGRVKAGVPSDHKFTIRLHENARIVRTDSKFFERILTNIISNSVKFSAPDSEIIITAVLDKSGQHVIAVRDFGTGIEQDKIDESYGAFYQGDQSKKRTHEGTGMGLALVRRLASIVGIRVKIVSKIGQGTAVMLGVDNVAASDAATVEERSEVA